jgi:hypothetical protein
MKPSLLSDPFPWDQLEFTHPYSLVSKQKCPLEKVHFLAVVLMTPFLNKGL